MGCEWAVNCASFGMNVFKYSMLILYQRLIQEWQDSHITYPEWVSTVVMDEVYYTVTLVAACVVSFAVGLILGIVVTVV
jgi:hypothetical protein